MRRSHRLVYCASETLLSPNKGRACHDLQLFSYRQAVGQQHDCKRLGLGMHIVTGCTERPACQDAGPSQPDNQVLMHSYLSYRDAYRLEITAQRHAPQSIFESANDDHTAERMIGSTFKYCTAGAITKLVGYFDVLQRTDGSAGANYFLFLLRGWG